MINKDDKIYVAGHNGMVGSAIVRELKARGYSSIVGKSSKELDLRNPLAVQNFFNEEKPDVVILAAAKVGGILANMTQQADFMYDNLAIQNNVIHEANIHKVKKLLFLGSSCIYPKKCKQPMKEEYLLSGKLEPTNEGYAIAKIAGLKMVEYFNRQYGFPGISLMPCNLYGTNDNFDLNHSHVLSALVRKFVDAVDNNQEEVIVLGSGIARREFMHVDDAAVAIVSLLETYNEPEFLNIGTGIDISIKDLANLIAEKAGYTRSIVWDTSKPDGMLLKCMDVSQMKSLGIIPKISLEEGIAKTIKEYTLVKSEW